MTGKQDRSIRAIQPRIHHHFIAQRRRFRRWRGCTGRDTLRVVDIDASAQNQVHDGYLIAYSDEFQGSFERFLVFPSAHGEPTNVGGLYGFACGGAMRVPGVMMTSPVDLRQISYTRSGSRRM